MLQNQERPRSLVRDLDALDAMLDRSAQVESPLTQAAISRLDETGPEIKSEKRSGKGGLRLPEDFHAFGAGALRGAIGRLGSRRELIETGCGIAAGLIVHAALGPFWGTCLAIGAFAARALRAELRDNADPKSYSHELGRVSGEALLLFLGKGVVPLMRDVAAKIGGVFKKG